MSNERRQSRRSRHSSTNNNRSSKIDNDSAPFPSSRSKKSQSCSNANTTLYLKDDHKENEHAREQCYYQCNPLAVMGDMEEAAEDYADQSLVDLHKQLVTLAYAARKKYLKTKKNQSSTTSNRQSSTDSHIFDCLSHDDVANLLTDAIDASMEHLLEQSKTVGQQWREKYYDAIFKIPRSLPSISDAASLLVSLPINHSLSSSSHATTASASASTSASASASFSTSPSPSTIPSIPLYVDGYHPDTRKYYQSIEESSTLATEEEEIDEQISSLCQQIFEDTVETEKLRDLNDSYRSLWTEYEKNMPKELIDLFNSSPPFSPPLTKQLSESIKSAVHQVKQLEETVRSFPTVFDSHPSPSISRSDTTAISLDNDSIGISIAHPHHRMHIDPNFDP